MEVFVVDLRGQGDREIKVVDRETFEWINNPDKGLPPNAKNPSEWKDGLTPSSQVEKIWRRRGTWSPVITAGSYNNDRALYCESMDGYETYSTLAAAFLAIQARGDAVAGEYTGGIY